jgi:hypothetical protein
MQAVVDRQYIAKGGLFRSGAARARIWRHQSQVSKDFTVVVWPETYISAQREQDLERTRLCEMQPVPEPHPEPRGPRAPAPSLTASPREPAAQIRKCSRSKETLTHPTLRRALGVT